MKNVVIIITLILIVVAKSNAAPIVIPVPSATPSPSPTSIDAGQPSLLILEYDLQNQSDEEKSASNVWINALEQELDNASIAYAVADTDDAVQTECTHLPPPYQQAFVLHYHFHSEHSGPTFFGVYPAVGILYVHLLTCASAEVAPQTLQTTSIEHRHPWQLPISTETLIMSTTNIAKPNTIASSTSAYVGDISIALNTLFDQHPDADGEKNALGAAIAAYVDLLHREGIHK